MCLFDSELSVYEFHVTDDDGIWGGVKAVASTEDAARSICRVMLQEEIEPNGSLMQHYELTLFSVKLAEEAVRKRNRR